ncbi:4-hydroxy-tetrahydrodipicolinate synthase [Thermovirga sp.]|uniref:4-hydroxy-tetrahydrodipicolinate synthase n=1 Tax=Thermovirga sp. TaxID=2699834 RepID=UPI0025F776E7|nr:4-hydroxy-tetrahydrodipicolinate synthase [Thermovirga sp.]MBO8153412.1 4-hydroxy-tetrahydrodipicolinate synthase [Thermovirga sp.]
MELKGIFAPIPTPFNDDYTLNLEALEKNMDYWISTPLDGIVAAGSNGEWPLLSNDEKIMLFKSCVKYAKGKLKVIAGTHCPSTQETITLSKEAAKVGCDAVLILPPHYYKGQNSPELLKQYFFEIADKCPIPVVLYNMPANTGYNMSYQIVKILAKHPNIIGIKDSSADIVQICQICKNTPSHFNVFAGSGSYLLPSLAVGCSGGTMAVANIFAKACSDILKYFKNNNIEKAKELQLAIVDINQAVTKRYGVPGLKAAMEIAGLYGGPPRPPLMPVAKEVREEINSIYTEFKNLYKGVEKR